MKFTKLSIFVLIGFLLCTSVVLAGVSPADRTEIQNQVILIANAVNEGDASSIVNIVSPNARADLAGEIEQRIAGKAISFQQSIVSFEDLGNNKVRVRGRYAAEGIGWSKSGLSNYFVFERVGDSWLLFDTDFHGGLGPVSLRAVLAIVGAIIGVIAVLGGFSLWMLIDAIRRRFDDRTMWILLIIFLGPLGAILYFFIVRRRLKRQQELVGQPP